MQYEQIESKVSEKPWLNRNKNTLTVIVAVALLVAIGIGFVGLPDQIKQKNLLRVGFKNMRHHTLGRKGSITLYNGHRWEGTIDKINSVTGRWTLTDAKDMGTEGREPIGPSAPQVDEVLPRKVFEKNDIMTSEVLALEHDDDD